MAGPINGIDSLPLLPGSPPTHRNVSGVCDDEVVYQRFRKVAKTIKESANMNGVLVSLQLVPHEVVCMIYPLINTEDFDDGIVMNGVMSSVVIVASAAAATESFLDDSATCSTNALAFSLPHSY